MTRSEHERAREFIALDGAIESDKNSSVERQTWLRAHLEDCADCREYREAAGRVVRALRSQPAAADSALVRATQMRVRLRAVELRHQQERLWVVCACCLAVTLGTVFATAALWRGFAWIGQEARLSGPVSLIGLVEFGLMPAIVTGIILLARGTYLSDHDGSLELK